LKQHQQEEQDGSKRAFSAKEVPFGILMIKSNV